MLAFVHIKTTQASFVKDISSNTGKLGLLSLTFKVKNSNQMSMQDPGLTKLAGVHIQSVFLELHIPSLLLDSKMLGFLHI